MGVAKQEAQKVEGQINEQIDVRILVCLVFFRSDRGEVPCFLAFALLNSSKNFHNYGIAFPALLTSHAACASSLTRLLIICSVVHMHE